MRSPGPLLTTLTAYREAVADVLTELAGLTRADRMGAVLAARLHEPELAAVLANTPPAAVEQLLSDLTAHGAGRSMAQVRIVLQAQIDLLWWGDAVPYRTDNDVPAAAELVDLEPLRRAGRLGFRYRRQVEALADRAVRAAERRLWPGRVPHTAGLRFAHARPEMIRLLNRIAADLASLAPPLTPPLWVTSLARSVEHQHRLRRLGYAAMLPSAHCVGWAVDIEVSFYRRYGAHLLLQSLLLELQDAGDANVIDEGQVWHLCLSPAAADRLRREPDRKVGA